jgi:chaperonin GroES
MTRRPHAARSQVSLIQSEEGANQTMATATAPRSKTKINIRPLGDKIIVKRDVAEERTDAGIYLPEQAKDTPKSGVVLAVGDGALNTDTGERVPLEIKKKDRVIFSSYAGTEIKIDGEDYLIMTEDDILAIFD